MSDATYDNIGDMKTPFDVAIERIDALEANIDSHEEAVESLANQVRNLANKLEEHLKEPDAHNPGVMRKK